MTEPIKKLRKVLHDIGHPLKYRIKQVQPSKEDMDRNSFKKIIQGLREIEDRRDFLQDEIGMDVTAYEDKFFDVIENLIKMAFNKEQQALIQCYLYQLLPDPDWDGTITIEVGKDKQEKVVSFKTADDVWIALQAIN
jgi:hypothetical protein|tara:strand:+ start:14369 stop:14779 length:411 start_codon:yes stop_codon:yes gene_type:complete